MHGIKLIKSKMSDIINLKGETTSIISSTWKEDVSEKTMHNVSKKLVKKN